MLEDYTIVWVKVIARALHDATYGLLNEDGFIDRPRDNWILPQLISKSDVREARQWFTCDKDSQEYDDFVEVCEAAKECPGALRKQAQALMKEADLALHAIGYPMQGEFKI